MSDRIIISGAGGFLGHRLCLLANGSNAIAFSGRMPERDIGDAELHIGGRSQPTELADLLRLEPAAWIDTGVSDASAATALVKAAEEVRNSGGRLPRFLITSSIGEYGQALRTGNTIEEGSELSPDDEHSRSKIEAFHVFRESGLSVAWAVLPMMWGPGDHAISDKHGRIRLLVDLLLANREIELSATTDNPIPDGFVDTIASALLHLARIPAEAGLTRFLVAGPDSLTPGDFIRTAADELRVRERIAVLPPGSEPHQPIFPGSRIVMDCSRLYSTGFVAPFDWRTGVRRTVRAIVAESTGGMR
ncbi:MAG TPA: NAD(P)-dependent oxidoreductase [Myxococcota bacterium]|nr:NAD(P)-dependent oxidoreductase [Myxococcota bacterium]HPB50373.1 NAD(P)-dependent oxidoreductase [Myxococcota bacterium]HQP95288.1 NAD(P)-dependent oxidoreductase [Myxococcota bacterium]